MDDCIRVRGARQHNLKNIDLDIPRAEISVITGPSGSGKSSLALDTLFAEGQRRYVESLSAYAKQFLDRMEKPAVDLVEGISPSVAIEQKNPTKTSRSTVGTATEVYDHLRLLFARVGRTSCPQCGRHVRPDTVSGTVDRVLSLPEGTRLMVGFPLPRGAGAAHRDIVGALRGLGFVRLFLGGRMLDLGGPGADDPGRLGADLSGAPEGTVVVVDRLVVREGVGERLADSVGTAFAEGEGEVRILLADAADPPLAFTERFRCPDHPGIDFPEPTPQLFSFNSPYGSCPECTGFGAVLEYDPALIVPAPLRSIDEGAVDPWMKPRYRRERARLRAFAEARGVSCRAPWIELPADFRDAVLHGAPGGRGRLRRGGFGGVIPFLRSREKKRYKQYIRVFLRRYQRPRVCPACGGRRLREAALNVRIAGRSIAGVSEIPLEELAVWVAGLALSPAEAQVADALLGEIRARVRFLVDVGLGYLALGRQTRTLSGGEAQRISLANSVGAKLVDTVYVLDEPSIGLHPRDTRALLGLLARLRDRGNTVIVVEHDPVAIRAADHVIELGPGSGERGGEVVFEGSPSDLAHAATATGDYLAGRTAVGLRERRRRTGSRLVIRGASLHNVRGVDLDLPLGLLVAVTGVSGSGKSTLVHDILYRALEAELAGGRTSAREHLGEPVGRFEEIEGLGAVTAAVLVDQSPIGRTPRSNPVTYVRAWDDARRLFARAPLARERGYRPRDFSFNVPGGRCEACKGAGRIRVEMVFMADVYVPCDVCRGRRYRREVLDVRVRGRSIAGVLGMTVDEAMRFFIRERRLGQALWHLQQVGLGYLRLGQSATTLSGGEAQRLKIARELIGSAGRPGRKLYLLDEPTTGLSGPDVNRLLGVLDRLVEAGNTVIVIEHNLELIGSADHVIEMGPGAGARGGRIVAEGTPEEVARHPEAPTAAFLRDALGIPSGARTAG